jgi:predicted NUDIX family NTP pyrophosphohydrolase
MPKQSAGILLHRSREGRTEVFLVHPGGPFYANRDAGAWSLPKGEFDPGEDARAVALREFEEETGQPLSDAAARSMVPLAGVRQSGGKTVHAWAAQGECDAANIRSNTFSLEWPPRSGRRAEFPEVDRAGWFTLDEAKRKILPSQRPFLDELEARLDAR